MQFRILGPLEVISDDGRAVVITRPLARVVAAALLLRPNRPVSAAGLVDRVWTRPPRSAASNLRGYLAHLRAVTGRIETGPSGYLVRVHDGELDADVALRSYEAGRTASLAGRPREAMRHLSRARDLWRDDALCDVTVPDQDTPDLTRFAELRLAVIDELTSARLTVGEHRELVPDLLAHTARHPLRERTWAQLMEALVRSDEPAAALAAYQRCAAALAAELGTEPGPALRDLHDRIRRVESDRNTIIDPGVLRPRFPGSSGGSGGGETLPMSVWSRVRSRTAR